MGHYLSEMTTDREVKERRVERERKRETLLTNIQADIDRRGIANVLADILENPILTRCRYSYDKL